MRLCKDLGVWRSFIPPFGIIHLLYHLLKTESMWDRGGELQALFDKVKILVKLMTALGIIQEGLPLELDVSVASEDMDWALLQRQQKGRVPLGFCLQFWKGTETRYTPTGQ